MLKIKVGYILRFDKYEHDVIDIIDENIVSIKCLITNNVWNKVDLRITPMNLIK